MKILSSTAKNLVSIGANIEITPNSKYLSSTVEQIIKIAKTNNSHVTVHAEGYLSSTLERMEKIGGKNVTIVI